MDSGAGLGVLTSQPGGPQNLQQPPMCPSPSAHSESSSGNGRLSSAGSEPGTLSYNILLLKSLTLLILIHHKCPNIFQTPKFTYLIISYYYYCFIKLTMGTRGLGHASLILILIITIVIIINIIANIEK